MAAPLPVITSCPTLNSHSALTTPPTPLPSLNVSPDCSLLHIAKTQGKCIVYCIPYYAGTGGGGQAKMS